MNWGVVVLLVVVAVYLAIVIGWGFVLRHDLGEDEPVEKPD